MKLISTLAICLLFISCSSKQKQGNATANTTTRSQSTAHAKTAKKNSESNQKITCTKGKEVRTLEVVASGNGCKVDYTKAGATTNPATSARGMSYCEKVTDKIQKNLKAAGYNCQ